MTAAALILAALLAAGALALPTVTGRVAALLGALVVTPILLVAHVWDTSALHSLRDHPPVLVGGAVLGLAVVVLVAAGFVRRPDAFGLLAVAALPFRVPLNVGGTTSNLLVPLYVVVGAGGLAYAWRLRGRAAAFAEERPPGGLERALAVVLVLYAVQATYSADLDHAVENGVFFYVPFALLFVLLTRTVAWTPAVLRRCLVVIVGLAVLFVVVGFEEYATKHLLLNPKVITSNQFESYFRVNSLFFDPNIYGRFLALVMLALAAAGLWTREPRTLWVVAVLLAVLWAGLVLTFSQSSFSALLLGLAVLGGLRWNPRLAVGVVAGLLVVGAAFTLVAPGAIRLQLGDSKSVDNATSGRADLVKGGLRLAADRPLGGWGSGSFARTYRRREDDSGQKATSASHTIPITVAAEQGAPGLIAYLALLVLAFARLGRGVRASPARAYVLAAFSGLVLHTMLYAAFLEDPLTWALLAVGSALAASAPPRTRRRPAPAAAVAA